MTTREAPAPTLDDVRSWPATVNVPTASKALGISASHGYALAQRSTFPVQMIKIGGAYRVITAALIQLLEGDAT